MERKLKNTLKVTAITIGSLFTLSLIGIAFVINFVFTPAKLTPVVLNAANSSLNARLSMKSIEMTFFSTFPKFGLRVTDGMLVSKALHDSATCRQDSLLSFSEAVVTVNPLAYLFDNKVSVHNILLKDASVYAYKDKQGRNNWDIMKPDTAVVETDTTTTKFNSEIDIKKVELENANIIFDDRDTGIYGKIDKANLQVGLSLAKEKSSLKLKFDNKNILFWQQGELLVNKIATSIDTDITIDSKTSTWTLKDTRLTVNGIELDAKGTFVRDTVAKTIDTNLSYGLHAPSVETVLAMIPESIMKKTKVSAKGEVKVEGTLKGIYGNKQLPTASLKIQIKDASAQYEGLPYGIEKLTADFDALIDPSRKQPSYLNLKIFHLKAASTDVLVDAKVEDLLLNPRITFNTSSTVDLYSLAKTFPFQESVAIKGKLSADLRLKCLLSSLKNQDIGRINLVGKLNLKGFELKDTSKDFYFICNAAMNFDGNNVLQAQAQINQLILKSKNLSATIENLKAKVMSTNPKDTTHIATMECNVNMNKLKASMGDSVVVYSGKTTAKLTLQPGKMNVRKPLLGLKMRTDTLFFKANKTKMGMDVAGIDVQAEKVKDSVWTTKGGIGFNKLRFSTPEFGLPIQMKQTLVTLGERCVNLKNASLKIGKSNLTANGSVSNLYGAMTKNEMLKAKLTIESELIDCNQLIKALSSPTDTFEEKSDTTSNDLRLFVIPKNIDFELHANIKKVTFDKMLFENVHGEIDIKDQSVFLKNLDMKALDANMKTMMVYKASTSQRAYTGFDFKIKDINISKLVDFIPSLDTIVPMLRSFKGRVDFDVVAETGLDSLMNIRIPSLKSAIHLRGDSLVLMNGETFAEISKMLMFKNKHENVFDSISVNVTVKDGNVTVYPFLVEIDRYKAAIGGQQNLDLSFNYHISILKSPLPFKAGVNISGTPDKMKFRIGKAKYKNAITPAEIHKVDSTRLNMGNSITGHFLRLMNKNKK
ncbi:MAG: AsmA-like C-terminal region-containing protein [Bacteroides sp.]